MLYYMPSRSLEYWLYLSPISNNKSSLIINSIIYILSLLTYLLQILVHIRQVLRPYSFSISALDFFLSQGKLNSRFDLAKV
jgi:hypothetical protein